MTRYRKLNMQRILWSSTGCFLGIGLVAYLSSITGIAFLMPPFGATCVIAFVIPNSYFAQPRCIIGGHLLSSFMGLLCLFLFGDSWWSYALAVGLSVVLMQVTRTLHPPAAADPVLLIMQGSVIWNFLITPVLLGSIIIVLLAFIFNNYVAHRNYPK